MANFFQRLFGLNDETTISGGSGLPAGLAMARQRAEQNGDTEAVQAIDNGTYKELLDKRAAIREAAIAPSITTYSYSIAGINYRKGVRNYVGLFEGYISPEPSNRYDPNAIAVYSDDGHHLGYIPATDTYEVYSLHLRFPIPVAIHIDKCYDGDDRRFFVGTVTIQVKSKNK
jgi:hypothetical protein